MLDPHAGTIIDQEQLSSCKMMVREHENLRWMVSDFGLLHGVMDLNQPNHPVLPYVKTMLCSVVLHQQARRVLNLGLGCGTIERYIKSQDPRTEIVTVEISVDRLRQVSRFFYLPEDIKVSIDDAGDYLLKNNIGFDLILSDLYGNASTSPFMFSSSLYENAFRNLNSDGIIALNYTPTSRKELIEILRNLRRIFPTTAFIEVPNHLNIIILGIKGSKPNFNKVHEKHRSGRKSSYSELTNIVDSIQWLPPLNQSAEP